MHLGLALNLTELPSVVGTQGFRHHWEQQTCMDRGAYKPWGHKELAPTWQLNKEQAFRCADLHIWLLHTLVDGHSGVPSYGLL